MTYLLRKTSVIFTWYYNMYPTGMPSIITYESSGAADDSSIAINDLSVGTRF